MRKWVGVLLVAACLGASACGDDDDDGGSASDTTAGDVTTTAAGASDTTAPSTETSGATSGDVLMPPTGADLGPENVASGEPVKIGLFHDGTTPAVDHSDDTVVAEALVAYWNEHQGGVGGRPVELFVCESLSDPAIAADCGNRFVEEGVVAVVTGTSGFAIQVYPTLNDAGIPVIGGGISIPDAFGDGELTSIVDNAIAQNAFALAVAREQGLTKVTTLVIDVPSAVESAQLLNLVADASGIEHEIVPTAPGTPDMLPQVTAAVQGGAEVVNLIYDPAGCLVALRALFESDYDGVIVGHDYCVSAEAFAPLPIEELQQMLVTATVAMGAEDDPDWQLYEAIMDEYATSEPELSGVRGWTYQSLFLPLWALRDVEGDITPEVVAQAINDFPEAHEPLGSGITLNCDGSKWAPAPAFCTNQILQATLNEDIALVDYQPVDVGPELEAMGSAFGG